jgi:hypothetical protein
MLIRREKLRRQLCSMKEEVFDKEAALCELQSASKSPLASNKSLRLDDTLTRAYVQSGSFYDDHSVIAQCNKDATKRDEWPVVHISTAVAAPPSSSAASASSTAGQETPVANSIRRKTNNSAAALESSTGSESGKRKKAASGVKQTKSTSSNTRTAESDVVAVMSTPLSTLAVKEEVLDKAPHENDVAVAATSNAAKKITVASSSKGQPTKKEQMKKLSEYFKPSELLVSDEVKRCVTEKLCPPSKKQTPVNGLRKGFNGMRTENKTRDAVQQCQIGSETKALLPPDLCDVLREVSTGAGGSANQAKVASGTIRHSLPKARGRPRTVGTPLVPAGSRASSKGGEKRSVEPSAPAVSPTRGLLNSLKRLSQSTLSAFCRIGKRTSESEAATADADDGSDAHEPTIDVVGDGDYSGNLRVRDKTNSSLSVRTSPGKSPPARVVADGDSSIASPKKNIHRRLFNDSPPSSRPSPTRALRSNANSADSPNSKFAEL